MYQHTYKLSEYDFVSEVDVNILGHIFENSLNEIEEVQAQLEGKEIDKTKTKRKKDGIFYTLKYITKYIVENTIGKLCTEKKEELQLNKEEYHAEKRRQKKTITTLLQKLKDYREWLLQLTIVDPACGSGAFLNEALNFLITENKLLDELENKLLDGSLVFPNIENSILENNLFGVDLNEESVEIAKLSLWLRTAQPNRKLNDLSNNIKCGNSLIDDPAIAGKKAFNWQEEFPQVFAKGGFDVVIGNPPYVKEAINKSAFNGLHKHPCYQGKMDLWYFFGCLGLDIVKKETGLISYIAPNNWITNDGASSFRNKVIESAEIIEFIDFGDFKVFDSAGIQTMIYCMKNSNINDEYKISYSRLADKHPDINTIENLLNKKNTTNTETYKMKFNRELSKFSTINFISENKSNIITKLSSKGNFHLNNKEIFSGIDIGQDFVNKNLNKFWGMDLKLVMVFLTYQEKSLKIIISHQMRSKL